MTFLFGDMVLDSERRELRSGSALIPIEPQVFDILNFLIRNRDRVVSKDDLLTAIWGGRLVSDSAIAARNTVRLRGTFDEIDVIALLPEVSVPTLVMHCRHDNLVPFEEGRRIATLIPNAKFVSLESENHVPLPGEPAWQKFIAEMEAFLSN